MVFFLDKSKQTPLHVAALHGHSSEVLSLLISSGANIRSMDGNMNTPLHLAWSVIGNFLGKGGG